MCTGVLENILLTWKACRQLCLRGYTTRKLRLRIHPALNCEKESKISMRCLYVISKGPSIIIPHIFCVFRQNAERGVATHLPNCVMTTERKTRVKSIVDISTSILTVPQRQ